MKTAMRVLIVEDDPMVMRLNVDYLARLDGIELVGQCESVPAALELLELLEREPVDLLLLDVYLRNRSGLEVLRHLRAQDRNTDAVLITAASEIETVRAAQRLGARDYLVKPFSFERFRDAIEACRRARESLARLPDQLGQGDIDRLFSQPAAVEVRRPGDLPKGLTPASLAQVAQAVLALEDESFTSETLLSATGMSRVSVRKYLKHLNDMQLLEESFHYGQIGRPSFRYRCLDRAALQRLAQG
ncbi:response regulator [Stutzerimonas stutzeri]|nr:response regulator [Stutzerimonas stutzeri]